MTSPLTLVIHWYISVSYPIIQMFWWEIVYKTWNSNILYWVLQSYLRVIIILKIIPWELCDANTKTLKECTEHNVTVLFSYESMPLSLIVSHVFLKPADITIDMANASSSVNIATTRNTAWAYHFLLESKICVKHFHVLFLFMLH